MGDDLKDKMIGAMAWSSVNIFGMQFIQLIVGIVLARTLTPEDFGKVGVLYFFIALSTVAIDGGFAQALIRKHNASRTDVNTIFYLNFFLAVLFYLILFFLAPYIALFFDQPELTRLSRILFISVFLFSLYYIQQIQLLKKLDYKSIAFVNIISIAVSSVIALILVFYNFGVWVLVIQHLSFHIVKLVVIPFYLRWIPTFEFSFKTIKEFIGFSLPLLGQTTLNVIFNNVYFVIIGRFDTIRNVGFFTQANKYSETLNAATQSIFSAGTFPIFSQVQDDTQRLLRMYRRLITTVALVYFPIAVFLIVSAKPLIITLISEKWMESVVLFQLLILSNIFYPVYTININLLNARGESKNTLKLEIFKKALILMSIIACFSFGIKAMLAGLVVANYIAFAASMLYVKKSIQHYIRHQIQDFASTLVIAAAIGGIVSIINGYDLSYLPKFLIQAITFTLLYTMSVRFVFPEQFKEIISGIRNKLSRKKLDA